MKIGELAKAVGCSVPTIRFYEQQGLLPKAARSTGNFRLYTDEHLQRLAFICSCRSLDISLDEIKVLINLESASVEQKAEIDRLLASHIKDIAKRIHELDHLRMRLLRLKQQSLQNEGQDLLQALLQHSGVRFMPVK